MTLKRSWRASARGASVARSLNAPTTKTIGGPCPTRSNAMAVPSLERTLYMGSRTSSVPRVATVRFQHTQSGPKHNWRVLIEPDRASHRRQGRDRRRAGHYPEAVSRIGNSGEPPQGEVRRRPLPRTSERKRHQGPEKARAGGKHRLIPCFLSDGTEKTPARWQSEGTEDRRA